MNVEVGAEAALFPEKEYLNEIAVAVLGRMDTTVELYIFDEAHAIFLLSQSDPTPPSFP
jgi:hypothetical protein